MARCVGVETRQISVGADLRVDGPAVFAGSLNGDNMGLLIDAVDQVQGTVSTIAHGSATPPYNKFAGSLNGVNMGIMVDSGDTAQGTPSTVAQGSAVWPYNRLTRGHNTIVGRPI